MGEINGKFTSGTNALLGYGQDCDTLLDLIGSAMLSVDGL